ncbi:MAG: M24 family metallopeptidase [Nitritalea sp.]
MKYIPLLVFLLLLASGQMHAQQMQSAVLEQRAQAQVVDAWLEERIDTVLPELMDRTGIDMWVLISREYNEDPVIRTFLPATWFAARRRTILVLYKPKGRASVEALAVARYDVGKRFKKAWDPDTEPDQYARLAELIQERNPERIGLNFSVNYGHADGLTFQEHALLMDKLPKRFQDRVVSAEKLAVGWLERRTPSELATYRHIQSIANQIIAEGLSENVITPGVTTTDDVVWFYRERIKERKLDTWFQPTVDIQRADPDSKEHLRTFDKRPDVSVIMPGDLLHIDFGISYLRLSTDTQQLAYVLKPGEDEVPAYLRTAFQVGNRVQDFLTSSFENGKTGNEILRATRAKMEAAGIRGSIYSHPMGYHGHAAGPTIGMWDNQGDTPGAGDYPLYPMTAYAIELNAVVYVEEWGKDVRIMLEEGAYWDGEQVIYLNGRQKEIMPIPRAQPFLKNQ